MSKEEFIKKIAAYIKKYAPCGSHSGKKRKSQRRNTTGNNCI